MCKVLSSTYSEVFLEYSEICFIMSELNGWDQTWYEKGVEASMKKWGVDGTDIISYMNNLQSANEENVLTQKYIALYMQPYEAWSEYRRTSFPKTFIRPGEQYTVRTLIKDATGAVQEDVRNYTFSPIVGINDIPFRVKYLLNEASVNKTSLDAAIQNMGGDAIDTKMWWMVN